MFVGNVPNLNIAWATMAFSVGKVNYKNPEQDILLESKENLPRYSYLPKYTFPITGHPSFGEPYSTVINSVDTRDADSLLMLECDLYRGRVLNFSGGPLKLRGITYVSFDSKEHLERLLEVDVSRYILVRFNKNFGSMELT